MPRHMPCTALWFSARTLDGAVLTVVKPESEDPQPWQAINNGIAVYVEC